MLSDPARKNDWAWDSESDEPLGFIPQAPTSPQSPAARSGRRPPETTTFSDQFSAEADVLNQNHRRQVMKAAVRSELWQQLVQVGAMTNALINCANRIMTIKKKLCHPRNAPFIHRKMRSWIRRTKLRLLAPQPPDPDIFSTEPLMRSFEPAEVRFLHSVLTPVLFLKGDVVAYERCCGRECFFFGDGVVDIKVRKEYITTIRHEFAVGVEELLLGRPSNKTTVSQASSVGWRLEMSSLERSTDPAALSIINSIQTLRRDNVKSAFARELEPERATRFPSFGSIESQALKALFAKHAVPCVLTRESAISIDRNTCAFVVGGSVLIEQKPMSPTERRAEREKSLDEQISFFVEVPPERASFALAAPDPGSGLLVRAPFIVNAAAMLLEMDMPFVARATTLTSCLIISKDDLVSALGSRREAAEMRARELSLPFLQPLDTRSADFVNKAFFGGKSYTLPLSVLKGAQMEPFVRGVKATLTFGPRNTNGVVIISGAIEQHDGEAHAEGTAPVVIRGPTLWPPLDTIYAATKSVCAVVKEPLEAFVFSRKTLLTNIALLEQSTELVHDDVIKTLGLEGQALNIPRKVQISPPEPSDVQSVATSKVTHHVDDAAEGIGDILDLIDDTAEDGSHEVTDEVSQPESHEVDVSSTNVRVLRESVRSERSPSSSRLSFFESSLSTRSHEGESALVRSPGSVVLANGGPKRPLMASSTPKAPKSPHAPSRAEEPALTTFASFSKRTGLYDQPSMASSSRRGRRAPSSKGAAPERDPK